MSETTDTLVSVFMFVVSSSVFLKLSSWRTSTPATAPRTCSNEASRSLRFPWEPELRASGQDDILQSTFGHDMMQDRHEQQPAVSTDENQQLEFLASMTFAGGGLRAPSCPCCQ